MLSEIKQFIRFEFQTQDLEFERFFNLLVVSTLIAYASSILPFLPGSFLGFAWTGLAWIFMLFVCFYYLLRLDSVTFPILPWLPWIAYSGIYIIVSYSFLGLQLTAQYYLPLIIGIIASSFQYSVIKILWLGQLLLKLILFIFVLGFIYYLLTGYFVHMASTPMLFAVGGCVALSIFFVIQKREGLYYYLMLFSMPFLAVTRMAMLTFIMSFVFHFANNSIKTRFYSITAGVIIGLVVVNSSGFKNKSFYAGSGEINEISLDYYSSESTFNSSGRKAWQEALDLGLQKAPVWGNGPRADNERLRQITGSGSGEAHNDYLSIRYNYGWVGLILLLTGFGFTFIRLYFLKVKTSSHPIYFIMTSSTMTLFIVMLMFMYSDNILKYTIFFPNYFFAMIGITFAMYKKGLPNY
ncbi:MAG: O-antigen ligase family protein [Nitritalea sp.]